MGDGKVAVAGLMERLKRGDFVTAAEGYLFEFERRGYLKAGPFVPEVVLEHPHLVRAMYQEFVHAGSDVVLAFTYYGHREKLRLIGREGELEKMNHAALKIAREVADETGTLMAGNLCNTTAYDPNNPETHKEVASMYKEQVEWAVEGGADFIIAETIGHFGEAMLALEAIQKYGKGLPSVICMTIFVKEETYDGMPITEAMKKLEAAGADVVGLNCSRGPGTMIPTMRKIREAVKIPIAALPVCYRTTDTYPAMQNLPDPDSDTRAFPDNLDAWANTRNDIAKFASECKEIGIKYVGLCCGNCAHYMRTLAETLGRQTPSSRYSSDMTQHWVFSRTGKFMQSNSELRDFMIQDNVVHPEDKAKA